MFIYKSPSCSVTLLDSIFINITQELDLRKPLTVIGDLNIDAGDSRNTEHIRRLEQIISSPQIVTEITTDQGSILDLAFSNIYDIKYSVIEHTWSDHKILYVYYKI